MNLFPVITRELQVQARQASTNRMRWIAAGAVMLIWCFLMTMGNRASPHERAQVIFIAIGIVCLGYVMMAGIFQTADCISEERREGTLGLLFLTDLKGYDVVLGKLASSSLHSFYTFLAVVPVMALPLLMGGMTVGEFWRVMLVLLVTLFLSLSVGMLISSVSRDSRGAMSGTFLVMLVLAGVMPLLWLWSVSGNILRTGEERFLWLSPPHAFKCAFDNFYSGGRGAQNFWSSVLTMLGIGMSCLLGASLLLPRVWQESGEVTRAKRIWNRRLFANWAQQRAKVAGQLLRDARPFLWLATRDGRPRAMAHWVFILLTPAWIYLYATVLLLEKRAMNGVYVPILILVTYGMHLILKCLVAAEASRRFSEDRASGALELLLVTPLRPAEIVASQFRGVWLSFRWCFLVLTLMNLALLACVLSQDMFGSGCEPRRVFTVMCIGGLLLLFVDGYALINVGMWTAMTTKRHARAFMATVMRVLLTPWLAVVFFFFLGMVGAYGSANGTPEVIVTLWFVLGGVVSFIAAGTAASNLDKHFREIASLGKLEMPPPVSDLADR